MQGEGTAIRRLMPCAADPRHGALYVATAQPLWVTGRLGARVNQAGLSITGEPSRSPVSRLAQWLLHGSWSVVVLLALGKALAMIANTGPAAWKLQLDDPDNDMRLAQIRDWLGGQRWFDVTQYRVDVPWGLHTHWSRIADLPTGGLIALLTPILGADTAERIAVTVEPPLLMVAAVMLMVAIAHNIAGGRARLPAALLALYAVKMLWEFVPGRIDHHALQIVLVLAVLAALTAATRARLAAVAALAAALSLAVSLETAPYLAVVAGWVAVRWAVRGDAVRAPTIGFFAGLAAAVPAVFAAIVPYADWAQAKSDALGRGHVVAAVLFGVAFAGLAALMPASRRMRVRAVAVVAVAVGLGAAILAAFPEVLANPYAMIGPTLERLWLHHVTETRTALDDWHKSPVTAVLRMAYATAIVPAGAWLAWRSRGAARDRYALLVVLAVVAVPLTAWHLRGTALAAAVATPVGAAFVAALLDYSTAAAVAGMVAVGLLQMADLAAPQAKTSAPAMARGAPATDVDCALPADYAELRREPAGLILGQINLAGPVLVFTPHSVLSAGVHRGWRGIAYAFDTWMAPPAAARERLRARGIRYVALCQSGGEGEILGKQAPRGLAAAIRRGERFDWLQPIPVAANPRFKLYRFVP